MYTDGPRRFENTAEGQAIRASLVFSLSKNSHDLTTDYDEKTTVTWVIHGSPLL